MSSLRLGSPFTDHAVLQRERPLRIWGWDIRDQRVVVELRTASGIVRAEGRADSSGRWEVVLPAQGASGPNALSVRGTSTVTSNDVWIGEVWLASGQSNMEWSVAQADRVEETIASATEPRIRTLYVPRVPAEEALIDCSTQWSVVTPDTVAAMTAVGYHFATKLVAELDVAVGIIDASWGGTVVEAWASRSALREVMPLKEELAAWKAEEADIDRIREEHETRMMAWEDEFLPRDESNEGEREGWQLPDAAWPRQTLRIPGIWQRQGLEFNGVVWFRLQLDLPAGAEAGGATLRLGKIDDFDHTYVNGTLVGSHPKGTPAAFQIDRRYPIPGDVLRPGRNVIAVRVFDHVGEGGFLSPQRELHLELASGERLPLAGQWEYRVEREVPRVPMAVFATVPTAPRVMRPQDKPGALYNGMIAPLSPLQLRGAIWYQGESNADAHDSYESRFIALIRDWRQRFENDSLTFLFVQLASFVASGNWAYLREAQAGALKEPRTGMVTTLDIGDPHDIHPKNKHDVGKRLADIALEQCHGLECGPTRGPVLAEVQFDGDSARVRFGSAAALRTRDGQPPRGFELGGIDGVFHPAEATLEGVAVRLSCAKVREPRFVRYAFSDCPDVNLTNERSLPAEPFRTDRSGVAGLGFMPFS